MDSEEDILKAVEKLMKDNGLSKLKALSMLHGKYQSERRLEEAVIVQRIIDKVKTENSEFQEGFYEDS
ncbi:MAG TPA: hypothetical protein VH500_25075 [Nitrososphaeraceae archaeon]|jgi:hypothetical protein